MAQNNKNAHHERFISLIHRIPRLLFCLQQGVYEVTRFIRYFPLMERLSFAY